MSDRLKAQLLQAKLEKELAKQKSMNLEKRAPYEAADLSSEDVSESLGSIKSSPIDMSKFGTIKTSSVYTPSMVEGSKEVYNPKNSLIKKLNESSQYKAMDTQNKIKSELGQLSSRDSSTRMMPKKPMLGELSGSDLTEDGLLPETRHIYEDKAVTNDELEELGNIYRQRIKKNQMQEMEKNKSYTPVLDYLRGR